MKAITRLAGIALKQVVRHRVRSLLTVAGVATGIFLFTAVRTLQVSLAEATGSEGGDSWLVVYRENRFCPMTSRLPERYLAAIERIPGVAEAVPVQIRVNNCGASLDVITFRGVPPGDLLAFNPEIEIIAGSEQAWTERGDAALVGEQFARRRGLSPGDTFEAVGVQVHVAGIIRSPLPQDNNVAYVHLPFLQQASRVGLGTVTQFNVRVAESHDPETVAARIDERFAGDSSPTDTSPEKAFFAQTARDLIEMISFTRWIGLGAVAAVLALVANALLLAARGRVVESAILQTVGFPRLSVALLMIWEGAILGLAGGLIGSLAAALFFRWQSFTLGNEGLTLALHASVGATTAGLGAAVVLSVTAALWPAVVASSQPIVSSLRKA